MAYHSQKLHVYNLPEEVLGSLAFKGDGAAQTVKAEEDVAHTEYIGAQACSGCRVAFTSAEDQKSHARSDLHQYNMKLRLRDQDPVTEEKFEELVENLNESLSGSADSDSDDQSQESTVARLLERNATLSQRPGDEDAAGGAKPNQRSPLIWLGSQHLPENTYWGVYRALLSPQEASQGDEHIVDILRKKQLEPVAMPKMSKDGSPVPSQGPHIFMAMIGGGHFAAMVVSLTPRKGAHKEPLNKQATVLAHKTFHRYTTRRKQGGAQSANDNSKGTAHSAGSGLRRYNEKALIEDVRTLLREWKSLIDSSELIFVRATGSENRKTLFGPYDGQVLKADDTRLRSFPFTTARATQNELMRCFIKLTRLQTSELKPQEAPKAQPEGAAAKVPAPQTVDDEPSEEEQMALLHTSQIEALIRRAKIPMLLAYFTKNDLSPDFLLQPPAQHHRTPTALHLAAVAKSPLLVQALLVKAGANPGVKNGNDRTAFQLAGDEQTREAFRAARGELGEERWNWDEAQVPAALSAKEMAALKQEREKQREQEELEAQQQRKKAVEELADMPAQSGGRQEKSILQAYRDSRTPQQVREDEERGMSPELRRKIERERRWRAIESRTRDM